MAQVTAPLYRTVANKLRKEILDPAKQGEDFRLPSERVLANQMGVSSITIRQAIKSLVAEGLITSRAGSGSYIADDIRDGYRTIAMIPGASFGDNVRSPWYPLICHEVVSCLEKSERRILPYSLFYSRDKRDERAMDQMFTDARLHRFAGVINIFEIKHLREGFREELVRQGIAWIDFDPLAATNSVILDYYALGAMGVQRLVQLGAKRIGMIGNLHRGNSSPQADYFGYQHAMAGFPEVQTRPEWVQLRDPGIAAGIEAFKTLWSQEQKPDGLLVSDDVTYIGVQMAMLELGVRYPQDLQLVVQGAEGGAFDGIYRPDRLVFSAENTAQRMVECLLGMIRDKQFTVPAIRVSPILQTAATMHGKK